MREEISAAVLFLTRLIEKGENFNHDQLEHFKLNLSEVLVERFENHWFPDKPYKGQGYRCIRVNAVNRRDPTLEKAARATGIKYEDMKLPCELTIWVDPNEVCCRFGEHKGSFCTLASFNDKDSGSEDSQPEEFSISKHSPPVTDIRHESLANVKMANRQNRISPKGANSNISSGGGNRRGSSSGNGNSGSGSRRHGHHHHHHLHHHLHAPYHHHQGGWHPGGGAPSAGWLHGAAAGLWQPLPPASRYHWPKSAPLKV